MKKRLLLYTAYGALKGNIWTMYDFYCKNLKESLKDQLEVVYVDAEAVGNQKFSSAKSFVKRNMALLFPHLLVKGKFDYWVTDSGGNFLSRLSKGVEVAHGYGTKQTPGANEKNSLKIKLLEKFFLKNLDAFITLSDFDSTYFYNRCQINHNAKYLPLGLPRNDRLLEFEQNHILRQEFCKKNNIPFSSKLLLYAPTWREATFHEIETSNLEELNELLKRESAYFLYRPHHHGGIFSQKDIENLSNFIFFDSTVMADSQAAISIIDCLITDYSSIFVDFLLLNKPIFFYVFDLVKYKDDRGLVIDYKNDMMTPGPKIFDMKELIDEISKWLSGQDSFAGVREEAREFFHNNLDNKSTQRLWSYLVEKLNLDVSKC
ncbi:CDP-glycerol glycerophosphotransferase family protein [Aminipila sp.]|uniref:CDP-glycerol glycerophosphotransferase family protein n=1 Tax=Aminipila sp. TaxID=2060095 RepID=UPI0028A21D80|nr:CDP-glycerol glycerophosphotransferase family protein [Aminipila sp.]